MMIQRSFMLLAVAGCLLAQDAPYKILKTAKVGGAGGFDYVYANSEDRLLYVPRTGNGARINVYNLDTLEPIGEIPDTNARGVAVSVKSGHAFASSKPVAMWDSKSLGPVKPIAVEGGPDGIMHDPFNDRIYVFSHRAPNVTVINAKDGAIAGTIDLGGAPEQAASDGKGHIYVDLEDKDKIAVIDANTLALTGQYDISGSGGTCAGLAMDQKNRILFATCRKPQNMVILSADSGKVITTLPIGAGTDGAVFNAKTMEIFSSQRDGTLTVVKENSPSSFTIEQTVKTMTGGKTLTLDSETGHIVIIAAEFAPPSSSDANGGRPTMVPDSFTILVVGK